MKGAARLFRAEWVSHAEWRLSRAGGNPECVGSRFGQLSNIVNHHESTGSPRSRGRRLGQSRGRRLGPIGGEDGLGQSTGKSAVAGDSR